MKTLFRKTIETPLGTMIALADEHALHLLEFEDRKNITAQISALLRADNAKIETGRTPIHEQIESELGAYFKGELRQFETPVKTGGTLFQQNAYKALRNIPYGETCSYAAQAENMGNSLAVRAVASANASNRLAIIIPCHRVIGKNGKLSGYAGGVKRKQALLEIEKSAA